MIKEWNDRTIEECERIVITPLIYQNSVEISEAGRLNPGSEQGGYLRGIMAGNTFYASYMVINTRYTWHALRLKGDFGYERSFFTEADKRGLSFQTIAFHNHPGENLLHRQCYPSHWRYKNDLHYETVKKQIEAGIFGNLSITEVLNQDARGLSQEDIDNTPGKIQILISPTYKAEDQFSHMQAYRIGTDEEFDFIKEVRGRVPLALADEQDPIYKWVIELEDEVFKSNCKGYKRWQRRAEKFYKSEGALFQILNTTKYYLDLTELESMSVEEAIKLARKRRDEENHLDALVLHRCLHEGNSDSKSKTLITHL